MITCQQCHTQMDDGAVFCDVCGADLAPASASASEPARAGQTPQPLDPRRTAAPVSGGLVMPPPITPDLAPGMAPAPAERHTPAVAAATPPPVAIILRMMNGQTFTLKGKADYTVGRLGVDHPKPDVDLAKVYGYEAGVSREHFMAHVRPDGVFVEDLESHNNTIQNGYRLHPRQWYPLHDGDELRVGAIVLRVSFQRM